MRQAEAITSISDALRNEPGVRALFLSGSFGSGLEDAYSDVDFVAVSVDGPSDRFSALWRDAVSRVGEVVLWWDRQPKPMLINAITEQWLRIDVEIVTPDKMAGRPKAGLKVLFDHDGICRTMATPGKPAFDEGRLRWQFEEFIRILGLLHLAIGREEYLNGVTGVLYLRNLLVELFIGETGVPNRGGALHLNRLITQEQQDILSALPVPRPEREALIAANLAYAAIYLPRARAFADRRGMEWPARFEQVTWDMLRRRLSVEKPYS